MLEESDEYTLHGRLQLLGIDGMPVDRIDTIDYRPEPHLILECGMKHPGKGLFVNDLAFIKLMLSNDVLPCSFEWTKNPTSKERRTCDV